MPAIRPSSVSNFAVPPASAAPTNPSSPEQAQEQGRSSARAVPRVRPAALAGVPARQAGRQAVNAALDAAPGALIWTSAAGLVFTVADAVLNSGTSGQQDRIIPELAAVGSVFAAGCVLAACLPPRPEVANGQSPSGQSMRSAATPFDLEHLPY